MATLLIRRQTPISRFRMISGALVVAVLCASSACSTTPTETAAVTPEPAEVVSMPGIWPPPESPAIDQDAEVVVLTDGADKPEFCGDSLVFDDGNMVAAPAGYERVGYVVCGGEYELPFNIFTIDQPGDGFVNNFYEVVAFDDNRTRIKIDGDKNQGIVMEVDHVARALPLTLATGEERRAQTMVVEHVLRGPMGQTQHAAPLTENDHLALLLDGDARQDLSQLEQLGARQAAHQRVGPRADLRQRGPDIGVVELREAVGDDALRREQTHQT